MTLTYIIIACHIIFVIFSKFTVRSISAYPDNPHDKSLSHPSPADLDLHVCAGRGAGVTDREHLCNHVT